MSMILEPAKELKVTGAYDTVVVGGGFGGVDGAAGGAKGLALVQLTAAILTKHSIYLLSMNGFQMWSAVSNCPTNSFTAVS